MSKNVDEDINKFEEELNSILKKIAELGGLFEKYDSADMIERSHLYNDDMKAKIAFVKRIDPEKLKESLDGFEEKIVTQLKKTHKYLSEEQILNSYRSKLDLLNSMIEKVREEKEKMESRIYIVESDTGVRKIGSEDEQNLEFEKQLEVQKSDTTEFFKIILDPESQDAGAISVTIWEHWGYDNDEYHHKDPKVATRGEFELYKRFGIPDLGLKPEDYGYKDGGWYEARLKFMTESDDLELMNKIEEKREKIIKMQSKVAKNPKKYGKPGIIELESGTKIEVTRAQLIEAGIDPKDVGWKSLKQEKITPRDIADASRKEVKSSFIDSIRSMFERESERY